MVINLYFNAHTNSILQLAYMTIRKNDAVIWKND